MGWAIPKNPLTVFSRPGHADRTIAMIAATSQSTAYFSGRT